mmetsp:Transcript_10474/g.14343  ORF Transcript_10474/g.14343 Transcript_10474/m.14343 type:complete len:235 (+) Transcript_10474:1098-1802(+)
MKKIVLIANILALTDGRDKLTKAVQYSLKIVIWIYSIRKWSPSPRVKSVSKVLSESRKVFRIGNFCKDLESIFLKSQEEVLYLQVCDKGSQIFNFFSTLFENSGFIGKILDLPSPYNKWCEFIDQLGDLSWAVAIVFDLILNWNQFAKVNQKKEELLKSNVILSQEEKVTNEKQLTAIQNTRYGLLLTLWKLLADLPVAASFGFKLDNPATIGFGGLISALLGLYKIVLKFEQK